MDAETISAKPRALRVPARWAARCEWAALALCLAGLLALKIVAACRYRFNSDEPQHLHVIWGWSQGLVQYRDLFDNHPPLFHMLMEPLFRLFPERADIVVPMRLMMVPVYAASLGAIWIVGWMLHSLRTGAWLALIAGALPWFFFPGTEFRPDDLYAALWFCLLAVAIEGRGSRLDMAVVGLLFGICLGLTLKTALAGTALALAAGIALTIRCWLGRWSMSMGEMLLRALICGVAALVVPVLLCQYFARQAALPNLYYCVFLHNMVPHAERWSAPPLHYFFLPLALPFLVAGAAWIFRQGPTPEIATRRAVVSMVPLFYFLLLYAYWPDITAQDTLPYVPLLPLAAMPLVAAISRGLPLKVLLPLKYLAPPAVFLVCIELILHKHMIQRASVEKYVSPIATVLRLTRPGEEVMDLKGDSIYRPRPFYYVLETFTKARMRLGWIKNDIVQDLVATRTAVCFHPPYPGAETTDFVDHNYLSLTTQPHVMVLGQRLPAPAAGDAFRFEIKIPGEYLLLRHGVPLAGILDGVSCKGPVSLAAGAHRFTPAAGGGPILLFWERAWELGYRPAGWTPALSTTAITPGDAGARNNASNEG